MSIGSQIAWDDTILPFQLDKTDIRGRVARMDQILDEILAQHDYPDVIEQLVCEAVMLTVLIGQTMKLRWKLSLQIRGDGPARLLATDYYAPENDGDPARVRAYASFDRDRLDDHADPFGQIGKGYFAILIHQGEDMEPYQGITPIDGGSLSACAKTYFAQSEQLPTRFEMSFKKATREDGSLAWRGGGVMLQTMPSASPLMAEAPEEMALLRARDLLKDDQLEDWRRVNILLDSVQPDELIGPEIQPTDLLVRLFHEESPRVFDAQRAKFGCTCSEERVRYSLSMYSAKDIAHMTTEDGKVTADCQFCGAHFVLDPATVGFDAPEAP
jgi:molecular chaperone Hsp33